jgi:hypothetical protein
VLEFLKSKENCISLLLKHLGTSAIMDLMLKLITQVEGVEMKQNILNVSISGIEEYSLLGCNTMYFGISPPPFWRNILPTSSGSKSNK